jgi:hypothetical protein
MFKSNKFWIILILVLTVINILGFIFFDKIKNFSQELFSSKNKYYAVYLNNSQIYLGNISKITENELILKNVYVLEIFTQKLNSENKNLNIQNDNQIIYNLLKWGSNDFLKNDGSLHIPRSSILFWTKLDDNASVLKQIK